MLYLHIIFVSDKFVMPLFSYSNECSIVFACLSLLSDMISHTKGDRWSHSIENIFKKKIMSSSPWTKRMRSVLQGQCGCHLCQRFLYMFKSNFEKQINRWLWKCGAFHIRKCRRNDTTNDSKSRVRPSIRWTIEGRPNIKFKRKKAINANWISKWANYLNILNAIHST